MVVAEAGARCQGLSTIPAWSRDHEMICNKIRNNKTKFKVVLKLKNEKILLPMWLEHYLSFLVPGEIIIADNNSTESGVIEIYQKLDPRIVVFHYNEDSKNGFHNNIHNRELFGKFYEALRESCRHFIFVDCDEFLILAQQDGWTKSRKKILARIDKASRRALATVWLDTIPFSVDTTYLGNNFDKIINAVAWGKPIVPSEFMQSGFLIHNVQFPKNLFSTGGASVFVLLHLKNYSREQRLSVNKLKLVARGLIDNRISYEDISKIDVSESRDPTAVRLVHEIAELIENSNVLTATDAPENCVKFENNHKLVSSGPSALEIYSRLFSEFGSLLDKGFDLAEGKAISDSKENSNMTKMDHLIDAWRASREAGDDKKAEEILRIGIKRYPDALDQFKSPIFCKELVRLMLEQGRYDEASAIVNEHGKVGEDGWFHILFARRYEAVGLRQIARDHWKKFSKGRAHHQETNDALKSYVSQIKIQPFKKILEQVPNQDIYNIFDIGANVGQSCITYARHFPSAIIHAFEPVPENFVELTKRTASEKGIIAHNIALSDSAGTIAMASGAVSTMHRVLSEKDQRPDADLWRNIESLTVVDFCKANDINHIDFMKIDTEGHDLAVLRGCGEFLRNIDFIQCEASANRYNRFHNAFTEIFEFLTDAGFYLFDIDGLTYEWANGGYPVLRRFDPVFINGRLVGEMKNLVDR
jgi:FkbM family methyltransferase